MIISKSFFPTSPKGHPLLLLAHSQAHSDASWTPAYQPVAFQSVQFRIQVKMPTFYIASNGRMPWSTFPPLQGVHL